MRIYLDLFTEEEVYSRFLVNPVRYDGGNTPFTGGDAIATSCLAAFGGFLSRDFRRHDFFLGRRNCQAFLKNHFVLHKDNSLFSGWTDTQKERYGVQSDPNCLPIIPLMGRAAAPIAKPDWPAGDYDLSPIHDLLKTRIGKLAELLADPMTSGHSWLLSCILGLVVSRLGGMGADKAIEAIESALRDARLE